MEKVIEFTGLTKVYSYGFWNRKQTVLNDVSFSVPRNSIFGFLGANGAGKTTAIKIIMGLQFSTRGEVRIFGSAPSDPAARAKIGYLPERPYFHDSMTAKEFLNFHRNLFGNPLKGRTLPSNADLLKLVGLEQVKDKPLKDFSKGMLQRAGIAQALVNDPELMVLDEPRSGLDPIGRREIRDLILKLAHDGKTIFFSSHILSDIENICHRIAFLEKGSLKFEGGLEEVHRSGQATYEVQFAGLAPAIMGASNVLRSSVVSGDVCFLHCRESQEAKPAIEEIWRLGGNLISFHREQRTLEEFLFGSGREKEARHV